jgi:hypothetical protein
MVENSLKSNGPRFRGQVELVVEHMAKTLNGDRSSEPLRLWLRVLREHVKRNGG